MDQFEKFKSSVLVTPSGCWEWQKSRNARQYGVFCTNGTRFMAHRWSYAFHIGPVPSGYFVCHKCDNPPCVNPEHLFVGTHQDNMNDAKSKGRMSVPKPALRKEFCKRGHKLSGYNSFVNTASGRRQCRKCKSITYKEWAKKNKKHVEERNKKYLPRKRELHRKYREKAKLARIEEINLP